MEISAVSFPAFPIHVMFIDGADKGIIPLTCMELFERVAAQKAADPNVNFTVEVSYIEVCLVLKSLYVPY